MKYDYVIGIDPDVDKNGIAFLNVLQKNLIIKELCFPQLIYTITNMATNFDESKRSYIVVVEAGWLNEAHWHLGCRDTKRVAAAKGNAVGRNHETGRKIIEMLRYHHVNVVEQIPLKKSWKGKDGKITHDELAYFTGYNRRNNQEGRDAALIAWCYANLPIRIKI